MQIDKAIEILADILHYVQPGDPPDEHDAIKLGIESLKLIKQHPTIRYFLQDKLLPGETP